MHHCLEEEDSRPLSESLLSGKDTFNCNSFLGLMALYHERTKNQDTELRAAFKVFDAESKSYIDWNTLMYVLMNAGEPLNEEEAVQMMKETDKDGTIDYEAVTIQTAPPRPRRRSREEGEIRERKQRERERKRDGVRDKQTQSPSTPPTYPHPATTPTAAQLPRGGGQNTINGRERISQKMFLLNSSSTW
ncbi:uncharacterized protein C3orf18 homolog isoform X4 [Brachyhypopomus gauderio]|uniref:uncharacterized protein C3orf18 homolog isoform X4 n=1 Tax=Brachyhypopomus gauderio TaxID=698409 RepID=UPI0040424AAF